MWASYVAISGYDGPLVTSFSFGDSADMATNSANWSCLGRSGRRRLCCRSLKRTKSRRLGLATDSWCSVATGARWRSCTTWVRVGPLSSVDDAFAWDEEEGDGRDLGGCRRTPSSPAVPRLGLDFSEDSRWCSNDSEGFGRPADAGSGRQQSGAWAGFAGWLLNRILARSGQPIGHPTFVPAERRGGHPAGCHDRRCAAGATRSTRGGVTQLAAAGSGAARAG